MDEADTGSLRAVEITGGPPLAPASPRRRAWGLWVIVLATVVVAVAAAVYLGGPNVAVVVPEAAVVSVHPATATQGSSGPGAAPVTVVTPFHQVDVYQPASQSPQVRSTAPSSGQSSDASPGGDGGSADEQSATPPPLGTAPTVPTTTRPTPVTTTFPPTGTTTTTAPPDDGKKPTDDAPARSPTGTPQADK